MTAHREVDYPLSFSFNFFTMFTFDEIQLCLIENDFKHSSCSTSDDENNMKVDDDFMIGKL